MLLTVQELAQLLHIKAATLYAWAAQGKIPSLKLHGLLRFRQDEIDQWLESCRMTSRPTIPVPQKPRQRPVSNVDALIEQAKRAIYTERGETSIASPFRKEQ
ncbi:MAG TPA: DNA-binding protein [Nitrospira sp.]|nr:DNA-binding protein [Nitrospira sp.]